MTTSYTISINLTKSAIEILHWVKRGCGEDEARKVGLSQYPKFIPSVKHLMDKGFIAQTDQETPPYKLTTVGAKLIDLLNAISPPKDFSKYSR